MSRVQSIERAFVVLGAVAEGPIGVTDVAERVRLPKSTAARLLASLAREGAVEQVPGESRYRLGPLIARLASASSPEARLVAAARPELEALASALGEAAGLSVRDGPDVHYIDQVLVDHEVQVRDWTGTRAPLHAVSSGLVFLAALPRADVDAYAAAGLEALTSHTVTKPRELRRRLERVRRESFAWVRDEFAEGLASVAASIYVDGAVIAAVHVHGPSYRFPPAGSKERLGQLVAAAAGRVGARLTQPARGDIVRIGSATPRVDLIRTPGPRVKGRGSAVNVLLEERRSAR